MGKCPAKVSLLLVSFTFWITSLWLIYIKQLKYRCVLSRNGKLSFLCACVFFSLIYYWQLQQYAFGILYFAYSCLIM